MSAAGTISSVTADSASRVPIRSARQPSSGGPARNAPYPIVDTTETRAAERAGSSAAALIPTGKPSEAPSPQTRMPRPTTTRFPPRITSSVPAAARADEPHSTGARPNRSSTTGPVNRPTVIAQTKAT